MDSPRRVRRPSDPRIPRTAHNQLIWTQKRGPVTPIQDNCLVIHSTVKGEYPQTSVAVNTAFGLGASAPPGRERPSRSEWASSRSLGDAMATTTARHARKTPGSGVYPWLIPRTSLTRSSEALHDEATHHVGSSRRKPDDFDTTQREPPQERNSCPTLRPQRAQHTSSHREAWRPT